MRFMKFSKASALISAVVLAAAGLTGCKQNQNPSAEEKPADTTTATTTAPETTEPTATTTTEVIRSSIDANAITFDGDSLFTCHCMNGDVEGESNCNLSIVPLNGDPKLKVEVLDQDPKTGEYMIPKLVFDLPALVGLENVSKIDHVAVDFDCEAKGTWLNDDGTESLVVGNFLGTIGGVIASEERRDADGKLTQTTWAQQDFECMNWDAETAYFHVETKSQVIPAKRYASDEGTTLVIMRWAQKNQVDFYIDNLTFYDEDGHSIPIIYDPSADTEASAETTDPTES